jgi:hypothetical protein
MTSMIFVTEACEFVLNAQSSPSIISTATGRATMAYHANEEPLSADDDPKNEHQSMVPPSVCQYVESIVQIAEVRLVTMISQQVQNKMALKGMLHQLRNHSPSFHSPSSKQEVHGNLWERAGCRLDACKSVRVAA